MHDDSELIQELKDQYGDIFGIELNGVNYVYRALTLDEIKYATRFKDDTLIEDYYVNKAVLHPSEFDIDALGAGYVVTLAEAIMSVSGILDVDTVKTYLETARTRTTEDVISVMKAYIIAAMPTYRDDELDQLTIKQMIDKVALAEQILTLQQAMLGIESDGVKVQIVSTEEYEASQKAPEKSTKKSKKINATKEEILRKISTVERETTNPLARETVNQQKLSELDKELLAKMLGEADASDPIAAKLHGLR